MKFKEDDLQMAVARYLDLQYRANWFHVANERKTSVRAGGRLRQKGVKAGVPDCVILDQRHGYNGLVIELKIKPNKLTDAQKTWLQKFKNLGYLTAVCYDFDSAQEVIDDYFKG